MFYKKQLKSGRLLLVENYKMLLEEENMNNQFSENLKKLRKDHHLSQEQLADEIGVSRQAISKWESSQAYPEMDKIITLCDKFNVNIDDLLHKDIREISGEEERRKKLNQSINDFLKYITDTINLFSNMNFKSKLKCFLEQVIIISILAIISSIIVEFATSFIFHLFSEFPTEGCQFLSYLFQLIFILFCTIFSLIIWAHIFKTRYLNYYQQLKNKMNEDKNKEKESTLKPVISPDDLIENEEMSIEEKNKIMFKKNENKIIIRDPKHSEYRFINGLFKIMIGIIKFFALCFSLFLSFTLVFFIGLLIASILISKTGLVFLGVVFIILASIVINLVLLLGIFNFAFNRKSDKKKMIWGFLISLIILGMGFGISFVGILDFEMLDENEGMLKSETKEYSMNDGLFFHTYYGYGIEILYVETPIEEVRVEYTMNQFCNVEEYHLENGGINLWTSCIDSMKMVKEWLKQFNQKKIVPINSEFSHIIVYASSDNIKVMKENLRNYYHRH